MVHRVHVVHGDTCWLWWNDEAGLLILTPVAVAANCNGDNYGDRDDTQDYDPNNPSCRKSCRRSATDFIPRFIVDATVIVAAFVFADGYFFRKIISLNSEFTATNVTE